MELLCSGCSSVGSECMTIFSVLGAILDLACGPLVAPTGDFTWRRVSHTPLKPATGCGRSSLWLVGMKIQGVELTLRAHHSKCKME